MKWEYDVAYTTPEGDDDYLIRYLDRRGEQGWELVILVDQMMIFKRLITE